MINLPADAPDAPADDSKAVTLDVKDARAVVNESKESWCWSRTSCWLTLWKKFNPPNDNVAAGTTTGAIWNIVSRNP